LALEYLEAISEYLAQPAVNYFEAATATFEESMWDSTTSDIEYVKVLARAGRDALRWYEEFASG
jgi:hypothetical protein